ncbi:hypothetical protein P3T76_000347 [Phytophthora citrophthora]|uniref:Uncharacterized protein n=1 Tax=Phytophthora citrophthora TaxID=4793 RepID=A0AAD9H019_9STRA|nr:hypothetical protein P3T76_000347 [Phytophthora citrophthora]
MLCFYLIPMKAWSDEWRCAQLELCLRDEELFHGETVNFHVLAKVAQVSTNSKTKGEGPDGNGKLLQRWKEHCEGARMQIQIVQGLEGPLYASSPASSPTTLFRQETECSRVVITQLDDGTAPMVKLMAQFDLKVRHEFWGRELLLIVHITPKNLIVGIPGGSTEDGAVKLQLRGSVRNSKLEDGWMCSQLVSLTREEAQPTPVTTRRVEQTIAVTKPLHLEVETRELSGQRVGIIARASNTHSMLALAVRDLHLHLDQSLRTQDGVANHFRVVSGDKVPFPVVLHPHERYNFLFVMEPVVEVMDPDELSEVDDDNNQPTPARNSTQKKGKSLMGRYSADSALQHTLLTLSWQATDAAMDAITENRAVVWSPKTPSRPFSSFTSDEKKSQVQELVSYVLKGHMKQGEKLYADFKCVRLLADSALQVTVAPLASSISVGCAVTVCVTVLNRSTRTDFDLTLVLPSQSADGLDGSTSNIAPAFVGFEASHRLGSVRPGMSVRRSLHVAFIRLGKCRLGPFVLVDHLTCTCFVSDDWEVFIKH